MTQIKLTPDELTEMAREREEQEAENWDFKELLKISLHHRKFIYWSVGVFLTFFIFYGIFGAKTYEAFGTVELPGTVQSANDAIRQLASLPSTGDPIQTYLDVGNSNSVALYCIHKLDLTHNPLFKRFSLFKFAFVYPTEQQLVVTMLKGVVTITNSKNSDLVGIQVDVKKDAKLAADIANTWAEGFIQVNLTISQESAQTSYNFIHNQLLTLRAKLEADKNQEGNYLNPSNEAQTDEAVYNMLLQQDQQAEIEANADNSGIVVVDKAEVPEMAKWPKLFICVILGLVLGFLFGVQGAFLMDKFQDRIKMDEDLRRATGITQLGQIPDFRRENGKLVVPETELFSKGHLIADEKFRYSSYHESFKVFRTNLNFSNVDWNARAIAVLSSHSGEGKTLVNSNLALVLAEMGQKVLLVDADLRKPSIAVLFGVTTPPNSGLPMLLTGKGKLTDMVVDSGFPNLQLLPNNTIPPNPAELLGSGALKRVLEEMKSEFDYVVFDCAPVLPVTDSMLLAPRLDGVILMARWNKTRRAEFRRSYQQLRSARVNLMGTALNAVEVREGLAGYGYGYGYGYGHGFGKDKKGGAGKSASKPAERMK